MATTLTFVHAHMKNPILYFNYWPRSEVRGIFNIISSKGTRID